jgi:phage tail tape-measure protein
MSITLGDAIFYFKGDNSDLDRATDEATQKTESASGKIKGFLSNAFAVTLGGFIQQGLQSITGGFGNLWHGMIDGNAEFERYNVQFGVLLGGADKAKARLDELAKFGAATPFDLPEIVKADKVLQSFGLHSEEAAKKFGFSGTDIRTIAGDVAAGTGSSFEDMSLLIGKFSAGATGEVLSRFAQMGVATKEELAQMGVKFNKAGQMMTPVPEATEKVLQLMKKKYGGMMDAQSKTFEGMMSNLNDWVGGTLRTIGQPIFEKLKDSLGGVLNWLGSDEVKGAIAGFAETLASGIKGIVDWATGLGQSVMDGIGLAMPYITTAWEVIQDLIGFVSDGGQDYDWFDGLGTKLSDLFGGSADDWRAWVETIGDNMTAAKDWITGKFGEAKTWVETL